jgi:hypothetical protein
MLCCVCNATKGDMKNTDEDLSGVKVFAYATAKGETVQRMYCSEACYDTCQEFYELDMHCVECRKAPSVPAHCLAIQYVKNGNYTRYRAMCSAKCRQRATKKASFVEQLIRQCLVCTKATSLQCSKCRVAYYCSPECQKIHWKVTHKNECCKKV